MARRRPHRPSARDPGDDHRAGRKDRPLDGTRRAGLCSSGLSPADRHLTEGVPCRLAWIVNVSDGDGSSLAARSGGRGTPSVSRTNPKRGTASRPHPFVGLNHRPYISMPRIWSRVCASSDLSQPHSAAPTKKTLLWPRFGSALRRAPSVNHPASPPGVLRSAPERQRPAPRWCSRGLRGPIPRPAPR
jgi:hypothetical protein